MYLVGNLFESWGTTADIDEHPNYPTFYSELKNRSKIKQLGKI
jgi:hypothetical protein